MYNDIIDTLDLVEELEALKAEGPGQPIEDIERRKAIKDLFDEITGYAGDSPEDGVQLIADSYFTEAMRELLDDCGMVPADLTDYIVVDWEATADNLRADYTSVEFDGRTYWYR